MERLRSADLRAVSRFIDRLYSPPSAEAFRATALDAVRALVPCDIASYNVVSQGQWHSDTLTNPPKASVFPNHLEIFERHLAEHPLIVAYRRMRDGRPHTISDFTSRRRFHSLGIYQEYYRRIGVEHQIGMALPSTLPVIVGVALSRARRDFSERERRLLDFSRLHLLQAQRNADAIARLESEVGLLRRALEAGRGGIVALTRDGRVRFMTDRARALLDNYFGESPRGRDRLPDAVRGWLGQRGPLVVEREGRRLEVRAVERDGDRFVVLDERVHALEPERLETLGLTRRQAEVLAWVAQGKSNGEVASILGISAGTVAKHMEHILQALGVETRTAAAAYASGAVAEL
jgi:DNA-binding CsgD family transcriptional regulator